MESYIAFLGIFIGVLLRTLLPAMRKMLEAPPEEPFKWDHRYTATAVVAVLTAFLVAVMAQYNPFAEHAGMKRIQETRPHKSVWEAIDRLHDLGFEPTMMASKAYNLRRLQELTDAQVDRVREILTGVSTHYYKRLMSTGKPYVKKAEFRDWSETQSRERFARCLAILSVLSETKVYLFWSRDWLEGDV